MALSKRKRVKKLIARTDIAVVLVLLVGVGILFFLSHNKNLIFTNAITARPPTIDQKSGITYGVALGSSATNWSNATRNKNFDQMKKLGVTSIRFDIAWSSLQPVDAKHYNWAPYDALITKAKRSGISSLVTLDYTPRWARPKTCADSQMCPPADNQQFADYAAAVVKRYQPQGVVAYEIWNEENSIQFWKPYPDAKAYQQLLHATATAMRAESNGLTILTGGTSPAGDPKEAIAPSDYLKQLYAAGAKDDFDGVAIHPYTFPFIIGQSQATNWALMDMGTNNFRSTMEAAGDAAKKIWITEYGAPTGGPGAAATSRVTKTSYDHVSTKIQAEMAQTAVASAESKPWLASLYWYTLEDGTSNPSDRESNFGLLDSKGNPKPAYGELQSALQSLVSN